jgi:hypothetical protein
LTRDLNVLEGELQTKYETHSAAVRDYNSVHLSVPTVMFSWVGGFGVAEYLDITKSAEVQSARLENQRASPLNGGFWVTVGVVLLIILAGLGGYAVHYHASKDSAVEADREKPSANSNQRETRFKITHEWSREFTSSRTEWLEGRILTPGVRHQIRPDGDDSRIRDIPLPSDPGAKGVDLGGSVSYVQWRIKPGQQANEAEFIAEYRK